MGKHACFRSRLTCYLPIQIPDPPKTGLESIHPNDIGMCPGLDGFLVVKNGWVWKIWKNANGGSWLKVYHRHTRRGRIPMYQLSRYEDGRQTNTRLSIVGLLATTFIPNPDKLSHIWFIDNNPSNFHADNMYWTTEAGFNNRLEEWQGGGELTRTIEACCYNQKTTKDCEMTVDDLLACLEMIPTRQKHILIDRYGLGDGCPLTFGEIGVKFNLTTEWSRQLVKNGLGNLKWEFKWELKSEAKIYPQESVSKEDKGTVNDEGEEMKNFFNPSTTKKIREYGLKFPKRSVRVSPTEAIKDFISQVPYQRSIQTRLLFHEFVDIMTADCGYDLTVGGLARALKINHSSVNSNKNLLCKEQVPCYKRKTIERIYKAYPDLRSRIKIPGTWSE